MCVEFTSHIELLRRLFLHIAFEPVETRLVAIFVFFEHIVEETNVGDGELERVDFAETFLIWKSWNVRSKAFKGLVDRLHATAFTQIGCMTLLSLLRGATRTFVLGEARSVG